jgi:hypothetical protein
LENSRIRFSKIAPKADLENGWTGNAKRRKLKRFHDDFRGNPDRVLLNIDAGEKYA